VLGSVLLFVLLVVPKGVMLLSNPWSQGCFNDDLLTSIQKLAQPAKVQIRLLNTWTWWS